MTEEKDKGYMPPPRMPPTRKRKGRPSTEAGAYKRSREEWYRMAAEGRPDEHGYVFGTGKRGYTWAPFGQAAGTSVPAVVEPMVIGILEWLHDQARQKRSPIAYLLEEQYSITLDKWARAEARRMRFETYVEEVGEHTAEGRRALEQLTAWDKRSAYYGERLGLDPPSLISIRRGLGELRREDEADRVSVDLKEKYGRANKKVVVVDMETEVIGEDDVE